MHKSQILFDLIIALHVSGVTITHLQEHKTNITTVSGNHYTVIDRVKFTDKEYLLFYRTYCFSAEYTLFNNCNFNLVYRYSLSVNLTLSITV
jgi:hypothetical protein